MCFFIPKRLVEFEYLGKDENKIEDDEASEYSEDKALAFFIVNFGYTKRDFEALTIRERIFAMKAWEDKKVLDTQLMANAFFNAYANANRKKGKKPIPLWKKTKNKKVNISKVKQQFAEIEEIEKNGSKDWVRQIYEGRR